MHRGSLYKAFGSKRGLFVAVLQDAVRRELRAAGVAGVPDDELDLLLVTALEVAPGDPEVAGLLGTDVDLLARELHAPGPDAVAALLGRRLLQRARPDSAPVPAAPERSI